MFVLMRFGRYLKNGRLIWHDKISPLKPPISPFDVQTSWEACDTGHDICYFES